MKPIRLFTIILLAVITTSVYAQKKKRIQPGKMYAAGDTLYAPRFGFTTTVPAGWQGSLPRENEVFLLTSSNPNSVYGEIYVFGRPDGDLAVMAGAWTKGVDLNETIKIKAVKPVIKDGVLSSEVVGVGQYVNKGMKGFAISKCSPNGPCITVFMVAPAQFYDLV